ncbi:hypothetical protein L0222_04395 [bacterium]|nr:hypothetical protein [bacterium]MCI0605394.1 hypothetical protein [bacterium]
MSNGGKIGPKPPGVDTIPQNTPPAPEKKTDSPEVLTGAPSLSKEDIAQLKGSHAMDGDLRRAALDMQGDVKAKVQDATKSKLDGAAGISKSEYDTIKKDYQTKPQSTETIKWLEKNHPHLYHSITSNLDYEGYVGTTIGSLNMSKSGDELKKDSDVRSKQLNDLPPLSDFRADGLPNNASPGDPVAAAEAGDKWKEYKTGSNTTYIKNDAAAISNENASKARQAQKDYCSKMSGVIGTDIPNPPSLKAAKGYFQTLASRGASPEHIKKEYGEYLKTFFHHPGGVKWDPKLDPKNLDANFGQQPVGKDGKRLIDCEGYAALTENVLGDLKKDGKPLFDIQHGAGPGHVFTGVFPHGGDPRKGFIVNNDQIQDVKWDSRFDKGFNETKGEDARMRFVVRQHWKQEFGEKSSTTDYGRTYTEMKPPTGKVPEKT